MAREDTQFKEGNPGRQKGSRNRLSETFLKVLADDFETNGVAVINKLRKKQPAQYCQVIGRLMPKLMELSGPDGDAIPISGTVSFVGKSTDD